jgi:IclR family acetate operon transcriptional repressor
VAIERLTPPAPLTGSPSVVTAFDILDVIAGSAEPVTMASIVHQLGLPKSSVFRLLRALESVEAVARRDADKRYVLGPRLRQYAARHNGDGLIADFTELVAPIARELNETMQLGVLTGTDVTFLACINSTQPVRLVATPGRTLPAHATATGKAILAFSPEETVASLLSGGLVPVTPQTISEESLFRRELARIRARGYSQEAEESTANLSCIAAPIRGVDGKVFGAVTLCIPRATIPTDRFDDLVQAVLDSSGRLSNRVQSRQLAPLSVVAHAMGD